MKESSETPRLSAAIVTPDVPYAEAIRALLETKLIVESRGDSKAVIGFDEIVIITHSFCRAPRIITANSVEFVFLDHDLGCYPFDGNYFSLQLTPYQKVVGISQTDSQPYSRIIFRNFLYLPDRETTDAELDQIFISALLTLGH